MTDSSLTGELHFQHVCLLVAVKVRVETVQLLPVQFEPAGRWEYIEERGGKRRREGGKEDLVNPST